MIYLNLGSIFCVNLVRVEQTCVVGSVVVTIFFVLVIHQLVTLIIAMKLVLALIALAIAPAAAFTRLVAHAARVLVTLVHQMKRTGAKKGLATLCIGGGQGVALAVEAP